MSIQLISGAANLGAQLSPAPAQGSAVPKTQEASGETSGQPSNSTSASVANSQEIEKAVKNIQEAVKQIASNNLQFSIDQESGRTVVRVVDADTGDTIRQIPSEEMLNISKALDKLQGLLLQQKA